MLCPNGSFLLETLQASGQQKVCYVRVVFVPQHPWKIGSGVCSHYGEGLQGFQNARVFERVVVDMFWQGGVFCVFCVSAMGLGWFDACRIKRRSRTRDQKAGGAD